MVLKAEMRHFTILGSTNEYLRQNMADLPDRTIVITDQQARGRGKGNHKWLSSNTNNLYLSILLKGSSRLTQKITYLTRFFSVMIAENLKQTFPEFRKRISVKKPNDLMINQKKVGGVLAESRFLGSKLQGVVLGLGLNFDLSLPEKEQINQPVTSLSESFPRIPKKSTWTEFLIHSFFDQYEEFLNTDFNFIKENFRESRD